MCGRRGENEKEVSRSSLGGRVKKERLHEHKRRSGSIEWGRKKKLKGDRPPMFLRKTQSERGEVKEGGHSSTSLTRLKNHPYFFYSFLTRKKNRAITAEIFTEGRNWER